MQRWYVAKTHPNRESFAHQNLIANNYRAINPIIVTRRARRGLITDINRPRFPGYVLVCFDISADRWQPIKATRGVSHLLWGEQPTPLPIGFVEGLQEVILAKNEMLEPGCKITVANGQFAGFAGRFAGWLGKEAQVLLALLGRETVVHLPSGFIERAA